jgi:hypothetical protein
VTYIRGGEGERLGAQLGAAGMLEFMVAVGGDVVDVFGRHYAMLVRFGIRNRRSTSKNRIRGDVWKKEVSSAYKIHSHKALHVIIMVEFPS